VLKHLISIVLLSAFLYQTGSKLVVLINFKINQDFIAKNLCVKKEIEDNDCEGNCCLKESLEKAEKTENPTPNIPKEKAEDFLFTGQYSWLLSNLSVLSENIIFSQTKFINLINSSIFHPPQVS
jgi:hypothetical protein